jgi:formylglycine-generating enzyme required for sulfatase activity
MLADKLLIVLLAAGLLLVSEQTKEFLRTLSVSAAAPPDLRAGQVFRDRMKNGTDGPEMVMIPAGRFRMGDIRVKTAKMHNRFTRSTFVDLLE